MKIKQRVMITHPELFFGGRTDSVYGLFDPQTPLDHMPKTWINCGVVEFDIPESISDSARLAMIDVIEINELDLMEQLAKLGKTRADLLSNAALIAPTPIFKESEFGEPEMRNFGSFDSSAPVTRNAPLGEPFPVSEPIKPTPTDLDMNGGLV